jgi:hypothetical protein
MARPGVAWRGEAGPGVARRGRAWRGCQWHTTQGELFMEYDFVLTGRSPILFHADDVLATDELEAWRKHPDNKKSAKGDDRAPAWTWQLYLYHDGTSIVIPSANIMACLRKAGASMSLPKGKGSFKALSQSSLIIAEANCKFLSAGKAVPVAPIHKMAQQPFKEQFEAVKKLGFTLNVKRARVGSSKHVRVRAMFTAWSVQGRIEVLSADITAEVLAMMFEQGGRYVGLLDWRPGSPESPGQYGVFRAQVKSA